MRRDKWLKIRTHCPSDYGSYDKAILGGEGKLKYIFFAPKQYFFQKSAFVFNRKKIKRFPFLYKTFNHEVVMSHVKTFRRRDGLRGISDHCFFVYLVS